MPIYAFILTDWHVAIIALATVLALVIAACAIGHGLSVLRGGR